MALYGQQDPKQVDAAICKGKPEERRVIFCTNVAETSLTIDGVTVVVDAGFNKEAVYDHQKHMIILQVCKAQLQAALSGLSTHCCFSVCSCQTIGSSQLVCSVRTVDEGTSGECC